MALFPNTLSFRVVTTLDLGPDGVVPATFSGRVRHTDQGVLHTVAWYEDGRLEDPARRTPAYLRMRGDGRVKQARHYRFGRLHDPEPGVPAVCGYFANGAVRYEEHYRYGRRHDGAHGQPAIVKYRRDGTVRAKRHYYEGICVGIERSN